MASYSLRQLSPLTLLCAVLRVRVRWCVCVCQVTTGHRHRGFDVVDDPKQVVDQVFCAALNIGQGMSGMANKRVSQSQEKCQFILDSDYEATYLSAIKHKRKHLVLTLIGGTDQLLAACVCVCVVCCVCVCVCVLRVVRVRVLRVRCVRCWAHSACVERAHRRRVREQQAGHLRGDLEGAQEVGQPPRVAAGEGVHRALL